MEALNESMSEKYDDVDVGANLRANSSTVSSAGGSNDQKAVQQPRKRGRPPKNPLKVPAGVQAHAIKKRSASRARGKPRKKRVLQVAKTVEQKLPPAFVKHSSDDDAVMMDDDRSVETEDVVENSSLPSSVDGGRESDGESGVNNNRGRRVSTHSRAPAKASHSAAETSRMMKSEAGFRVEVKKELKVGDCGLCMHNDGMWYRMKVKQIKMDVHPETKQPMAKLFIHFAGWGTRNDSWEWEECCVEENDETLFSSGEQNKARLFEHQKSVLQRAKSLRDQRRSRVD